jgi:hypothetical protein
MYQAGHLHASCQPLGVRLPSGAVGVEWLIDAAANETTAVDLITARATDQRMVVSLEFHEYGRRRGSDTSGSSGSGG